MKGEAWLLYIAINCDNTYYGSPVVRAMGKYC